MSDSINPELAATQIRATAGTSTGPKTAEGKARSSLNALKHGRFSRHGSLLKYECDRVFLDTYRQLLAAWSPADRFEASLVQQLAHIEWSLFRCRAIETSLLESAFNRQDNSYSGLPQPLDCLDRLAAGLDRSVASSALPSWITLRITRLLQERNSTIRTLGVYRKLPSESPQPIHSKNKHFGSNPNSNPIRTPFGPHSDYPAPVAAFSPRTAAGPQTSSSQPFFPVSIPIVRPNVAFRPAASWDLRRSQRLDDGRVVHPGDRLRETGRSYYDAYPHGLGGL